MQLLSRSGGLRPIWLALAILAVALVPCSAVTISVNGNTPNTLVGGTFPGAFVDGYNTSNNAFPSSFSSNYLVMGDGTASSAPIAFKDVPYVTLGVLNEIYFVFTYDAQETNPARPVSLDVIELLVNNVVIWSSTDQIVVNNDPLDLNHTLTPLGNGSDMALYLPVYYLAGYNFTGNTQFVFRVTQSDSDNGNDEWRLTNFGVSRPINFFGPNDPITGPAPVPEPSSLALVAAAGVAWFARRRHRRN